MLCVSRSPVHPEGAALTRCVVSTFFWQHAPQEGGWKELWSPHTVPDVWGNLTAAPPQIPASPSQGEPFRFHSPNSASSNPTPRGETISKGGRVLCLLPKSRL